MRNFILSTFTSIKLAQPMQHNWIKHKQTFSTFLMLICFIRDFIAQANSIKTMAVLT